MMLGQVRGLKSHLVYRLNAADWYRDRGNVAGCESYRSLYLAIQGSAGSSCSVIEKFWFTDDVTL
jgi:hypothetical protein